MEIALAQDKDAGRWDEYVIGSPDASPYHLFAWKQAIESSYRQKSYYLMALDHHDRIIGVLPSILITPPFGSATLCSLPYCDRGEALADSEDVVEQLISKAGRLRQQLGARRYEYRSTKSEKPGHGLSASCCNHQKVRMILELPATSELLFSGFKSKLRSQIRKAQKNGLSITIGNQESLVSDFYGVFTINMRDLGSPVHSKQWFESIRRYYADNCIISVVSFDSLPIGAALVLINGNKATVPWASTLRQYNRLAPNMLLYWSLLEYVTDNGCRAFDFGRSSIGEGTYRFKQQWGARPVELDWTTYPQAISKEPSDGAVSKNSTLRKTAEQIWRKLPLPVTIELGSRIRKYITL